MVITWHGHYTVKIVTRGVTVVLDPHAPSKDISPFRSKADAVALSNPSDASMSHTDGIQGSPIIIDTPGEYSVKGLNLYARGWHHRDGSERNLQRWRIEEVCLLHLGTLDRPLTTEELQGIERVPVDILLLPVNDYDKKIITTIEPRVVIPVNHTSIKSFAKEMGVSSDDTQPRFNVDARKLPSDELATVILSP